MSMIDSWGPTYTFSYDKLETPLYKYVKDSDSVVHRVKVTEYVTSHNCSNREDKYVYAKYQILRTTNLESKMKRMLNVLFDRSDRIKKEWMDIESQFYSSDFYSSFSPSGLVQEECLYDTFEAAEKGRASYIFRDYNPKKR